MSFTVQLVDNYEYELPSDFEDEEIDEDAAFTEEDKKLYAGWFEGTEAALAGKGKADIGDGLLDSDNEGGEDDEYNTDDFSAEVSSWP
jgi:U3 small nucleolar RNA-associated protein 14